MVTRVETIEQCQREAVRLRAILPKATTPAIKTRLMQRIEEFERVVRGEAEAPELERVS